MGQVGAFPGINDWNRRTIRGPVNPMDKATVVSIYPNEIDEIKHTISPGRFIIPAGTYERPAILVVGPSSWWREMDHEQPLLEIPTSSIQIAEAIVKDWSNGILACNMADTMPGIFYVMGEQTVVSIKKSYQHELDKAKVHQQNWFSALIKLADALWARSNGNPLAISDTMRMAAKEMNLTVKDWMKDFRMVDMVRCFACGSLKNPQFPVCATCRAIDPEHAVANNIKFAV